MCGIAALVNFQNINTESIVSSLYHRGPNEQSVTTLRNVTLIHTRLSIQDISLGSQPLTVGNYTIIFNGEIYNHLEIRSLLNFKKYKTNSDTETFLTLFIEKGISGFDLVDGMFAFVIINNKSNEIIFGRDRIGKKPLYYFHKENRLFISSELKTLSNNLPSLDKNYESIESFFKFGFFLSGTTPFKNVIEVQPGFILRTGLDRIQISSLQYFNIAKYYQIRNRMSLSNIIDKVESDLRRSIKDRIESSDIEVGAFLSGGIDSSLIVSLAKNMSFNLKCFTIAFKGENDESLLAKKTIEMLGFDHKVLSIETDIKNDIEKILSLYGEPFMDSSAIPSYYVSREASKYIKVVLNGDGADELFGGYRRYVISNNNILNFLKYFGNIIHLMPHPRAKDSYYNYLYRLINLSRKKGIDYYLASTNDIFEDYHTFSEDNPYLIEMENLVSEVNEFPISVLKRNMLLDKKLILPSDLLKKMDIASMSNSIEARSPFLSKYMLEFAPTIEDKYKIKGLKTKYILRSLAKKYNLGHIYKQPKRGFEVPLIKWVNEDLGDMIRDSIKSEKSLEYFFNKTFINNIINKKIKLPEDKRSKMMWSMFTYSIWNQNIKK